MRICLSIPFGSYLHLLHLLEMQTVIKTSHLRERAANVLQI